jgi:dipeptidase D
MTTPGPAPGMNTAQLPASTANAIAGLQPAAVWELFAEMNTVPRPSKHEEKIVAHMAAVADRLGLAHHEDALGNMVIEVPATPGHENVPITILQGHVDMVCEANAGTAIDFMNDPIELIRTKDTATGEDIIVANNTTLGADNGIGVCMALAAATDPNITHGPLELLLTIDEEMGMTGAKALTPDFMKGRRLINLDSEEDDAIYIGCAGGTDVTLKWTATAEPLGTDEIALQVSVTGCRGGHSGGDIHQNRGNANRLLAQTLIMSGIESLRLVSLDGGSKRNAIPREAAVVVVINKSDKAKLEDAAAARTAVAQQTHHEADCTIAVKNANAPAAMNVQASAHVLRGLVGIPCGVISVVPEIAGLVQTSNNLSTIETKTDSGSGGSGGAIEIIAGCLTRSSSADDMRSAVEQIRAVGQLSQAVVETGNEYPGWQPNVDSPLLAVCRDVYTQLFNEQPLITAIHAGLECGIIGERVGEIDTVSFGPHIEGAHSPDERVFIDSVAKSYKMLAAVLEALTKR